MLRITINQETASILLVLEGRLCGAWVEELRKVIAGVAADATSNRVVIALTCVSAVDPEGRQLLAKLHADGVGLIGTGLTAKALIEEIHTGGALPQM
jgi:anti-anti-sigma regulatory factor